MLPVDEDDNDDQPAVQVQDDEDVVHEEENEVSMNTIRDNIANASVS
jgi:hypothetical protein